MRKIRFCFVDGDYTEYEIPEIPETSIEFEEGYLVWRDEDEDRILFMAREELIEYVETIKQTNVDEDEPVDNVVNLRDFSGGVENADWPLRDNPWLGKIGPKRYNQVGA